MGNGGSSIGDLFFPDNPSRRRRAEQLRSDINGHISLFEEQRRLREDTVKRIKPKLDKLLKDRGFHTPDQLESKVRSVLKGPELENYNRLSARLNKADEVEGIAWQVISFIGATAGVLVGGAFIAGIVTGGAALALIGAVGEALAVIGIVIALLSVIEGAIERDNLREAINQLFPKRAEVKLALEQMRAIANWVQTIEIWLSNPDTSNPAILDQLLAGTLDRDYNAWNLQRAYDTLHRWDVERGAWTNEDPSYPHLSSIYMAATERSAPEPAVTTEPAIAKTTIKVLTGQEEAGGEPPVFDLVYSAGIDAKNCTANDTKGNPWKLSVAKTDDLEPSLGNTLFDLENLSTKLKYSAVRLEVLGTSVA